MTAAVKRFITENKKIIWPVAALLLIIAVVTAVLLACGVFRSGGSGADLTIDLFQGEGYVVTDMRAALEKAAQSVSYGENTAGKASALISERSLSASGGFAARLANDHDPIKIDDGLRIWDTDTRVEIFKVSYQNGEATVVSSGNGDRIIAPGTANSYSFRLLNTAYGYADYKLIVEATVTGLPSGRELPVQVRFCGPGGYIVGAEDIAETEDVNEAVWGDIRALNVEDAQTLEYNGSAYYRLDWRWPFESGDDELDTLLGNMTVDTPITLTIRIGTVANYHWYGDPVLIPIPSRLNTNSEVVTFDSAGHYIRTGSGGKLYYTDDSGEIVYVKYNGFQLCRASDESYYYVNENGERVFLSMMECGLSETYGPAHFAYIFGYPDGGVHPEANITRAETATIFYRLLVDSVRERYYAESTDYTDVKDGAWYTVPVATLTNMGIMNGYPDGSFHPNDTITRAELAAICARFADYKQPKVPTAMTDIAGHWAEMNIRICERNGWIDGYPDGSFRPNNSITRAELITVVNRILHRLPERRTDMYEQLRYWNDNANESAWYYIAVQEATESHLFDIGTGTSEFWVEPDIELEWLMGYTA